MQPFALHAAAVMLYAQMIQMQSASAVVVCKTAGSVTCGGTEQLNVDKIAHGTAEPTLLQCTHYGGRCADLKPTELDGYVCKAVSANEDKPPYDKRGYFLGLYRFGTGSISSYCYGDYGKGWGDNGCTC